MHYPGSACRGTDLPSGRLLYMIISVFGNELSQLGHCTAQILGPEPERMTIGRKFCHGSVLVLGSCVVKALAHTAGDSSSNPDPG